MQKVAATSGKYLNIGFVRSGMVNTSTSPVWLDL